MCLVTKGTISEETKCESLVDLIDYLSDYDGLWTIESSHASCMQDTQVMAQNREFSMPSRSFMEIQKHNF